jgi:hypothetical protein
MNMYCFVVGGIHKNNPSIAFFPTNQEVMKKVLDKTTRCGILYLPVGIVYAQLCLDIETREGVREGFLGEPEIVAGEWALDYRLRSDYGR